MSAADRPSLDGEAIARGEMDEAGSAARRLRDEVWGSQLDWLVDRSGRPVAAVRTVVGKWLRDHGEIAVNRAIMDAATRGGTAEPIAWISKALQGISKGMTGHGRPRAQLDDDSTRRAVLEAVRRRRDGTGLAGWG
ncbi:hypothetical protein P7L78_22045 [Tistrella bauzanensis]|uniref:hypothetical protein n=1 Tax=Tistrella TaxID=171436 RepID=UPI0031F71E29